MLVSNKSSLFKILIMLILILTIFCLEACAVVEQTKQFYVNDYANLISKSTEQYIINTNLNLYNQTGAQIVVVTVQNLEGKSIEEYATELFRKFGIGSANKDNGVLMVLALEEREFRIEVGYGLEGALPDAKTGRIQDQYIIPHLTENNWDAGIRNGFNAIIQVVANEYGVTVNSNEPLVSNSSSESDNISDYMPLIMIGIFFLVFIVAIKNGATVSYGGYHGGYYHSNRGFSGGRTSSRSSSSYRSSRSSFGGGGSSGGGR